jgi:putative chitinase
MSMRGTGAATAPATPSPSPLAVTAERLWRLVPSGKPAIMAPIAENFDRLASRYDITTRLRICHFLAQAAHESDGFRTLREYGGPAYFKRYDARRDLGNTMPGDGARYHGRGIFQLTGRFNYRRYGELIGIDLEADPDRAMEPAISLSIAFAYWREREINVAADADDVARVTKRINGGRTGLADRTRLLAAAKAIWS